RAAGARPGSRAGDTPTQPSPERGRASGLVAGEGDLFGDADKDAVGILQHIVVPEADHAIAMRLDLAGADIVGRTVGMLAAIDLDRQLQSAAGEVGDGVSDLVLTSELNTHLACAQVRPKAPFGVGHLPPQPLRNRRQALSCHASDTPTQPSPERGRAYEAIAA